MKNRMFIVTFVLVFSAVSLFAAVEFDTETGMGFIGKGDVQLALGWNNKKMQDNATALDFTYVATQNYSAVCNYWTGPTHNRKEHNVPRTTISDISAVVGYDGRSNKKGDITGFFLGGFTGVPIVIGDAVPVENGPCSGGDGGYWSDVQETDSTGGLFVVNGDCDTCTPVQIQ
jgi:hypothetical protein